MKNKLTQNYLKECLSYSPDTGIFIWNKRPLSHFKNSNGFNTWNSRYANKFCGTRDKDGYLIIVVNSELWRAHRLAFLYMEGYIPENEVDHKDRNRLNNKWDNLREVSCQCNRQNSGISISNKSGVTGVHWYKQTNKWRSQIKINSKFKHIGYFDNFEDAVKARYQEEINNTQWTCSIESSALKYIKENNLI